MEQNEKVTFNFNDGMLTSKGRRMLKFFVKYNNAVTDEEKEEILVACRRKEHGEYVADLIKKYSSDIEKFLWFLFQRSDFVNNDNWNIVKTMLDECIEFTKNTMMLSDCHKYTDKKGIKDFCDFLLPQKLNNVFFFNSIGGKLQDVGDINIFCANVNIDLAKRRAGNNHKEGCVVIETKYSLELEDAPISFSYGYPTEDEHKQRDFLGYYFNYCVYPKIDEFLKPDVCFGKYIEREERDYKIVVRHGENILLLNEACNHISIMFEIPIFNLTADTVRKVMDIIKELHTKKFV